MRATPRNGRAAGEYRARSSATARTTTWTRSRPTRRSTRRPSLPGNERRAAAAAPRLSGPDRGARPLRREEREVGDADRGLAAEDVKGFYERQGWGPTFVTQTFSRFDVPHDGQAIALSGAPPSRCRASRSAGDRGITRVEISTDDGQTWQNAQLDYQTRALPGLSGASTGGPRGRVNIAWPFARSTAPARTRPPTGAASHPTARPATTGSPCASRPSTPLRCGAPAQSARSLAHGRGVGG